MFKWLWNFIECAQRDGWSNCLKRDREEEPGRAELRMAVQVHKHATEDASNELNQARVISRYQLNLANEALAMSDRAIQRKQG